VKVYPGVFHPGLFFSTKILLGYLKIESLQGMKVLELGAGSGLLSIYCAKHGAIVTASDISKNTTDCLRENAMINNVQVAIVLSDLFDCIDPSNFDMIIINPPFYPRDVQSEKDFAWFCGSEFEYFKKLFCQLSQNACSRVTIVMVLSEDCDINQIQTLAKRNGLLLNQIYKKKSAGEDNYIFKITAG
jgi:release factor glutamine methyltransferase